MSVLDDIYINQEQTKKFAVVNPLNQGIYTQPQGSFNSVLYTSYKFNNKAVKVVEEADTLTGKYSKILRIEDNSTIGWIKTSEITETNFTKTISIHNFYGKVITGNDGIYTKPFGDFDSILYTTYKYNNNEVKIIEEVTTVSGNFYKISDILSGKIHGWIRSSSIEKYDRIEDVTSMELYGFVRSGNDGIYTKPKGLPGAILYTTYKMNNKEVKAIERVKVDNIEFLKLTELTSGKFIGWIKASDIELYESIQSTIKREYSAKVSQKNQGIYTAPKGTYGAILYTSYLFNNKYVKVVEESVTDSGTFSKLVRVEDGSTIGWINKDDLITQRTVFIDAGHGGSDSGAHYYGVSEKDINLQVANKLKAQLEAQGYAVIMSRTTDVFVDIVSERSEMANKSGAEIFVSIHHNAMPGNSIVNGIETFHYQYNSSYPPIINQDMHNDENRLLKSAALANEIQNSLISNTGAYDRGVQRETFAVLRETALPAVLLELGFMSNSTELNKLTTSTYQNTLANAVTLGINSYFKTN